MNNKTLIKNATIVNEGASILNLARIIPTRAPNTNVTTKEMMVTKAVYFMDTI